MPLKLQKSLTLGEVTKIEKKTRIWAFQMVFKNARLPFERWAPLLYKKNSSRFESWNLKNVFVNNF